MMTEKIIQLMITRGLIIAWEQVKHWVLGMDSTGRNSLRDTSWEDGKQLSGKSLGVPRDACPPPRVYWLECLMPRWMDRFRDFNVLC